MSSVERIFREHRSRVLASLIGFLGDFDLAEEAVQDAFAAALVSWPPDAPPENPAAWLITTARHRAVDRIRRAQTLQRKLPQIAAERPTHEPPPSMDEFADTSIPDERLELIFTCCHPALNTEAQVALTLRTLGGLDTAEIGRAFLVAPEAMKRRLSRAKAKVKGCGIPFRVPRAELLPARLDAVLAVLYLIFNQGYGGADELADEAVRLGRLLVSLMPDEAEPLGLLALMETVHARRASRTDAAGDLVLLADQDRTLWDQAGIARGRALLTRALRLGPARQYTLQAAVAAEHVADEIDWEHVAALYQQLAELTGSPVVEISRAVALAETGATDAALAVLDAPLVAALDGYQYLHSTRGELLARLGRRAEAEGAFVRALELAATDAERRFLARRIGELER